MYGRNASQLQSIKEEAEELYPNPDSASATKLRKSKAEVGPEEELSNHLAEQNSKKAKLR